MNTPAALFDADPSAREPLRERWKQYKARGYDVNKHDM